MQAAIAHGTFGDLVGGIPGVVEGLRCQAPGLVAGFLVVFHQRVALVQVLRVLPGPVIAGDRGRRRDAAGKRLEGLRTEQALVRVLSGGQGDIRLFQGIHIGEFGGAGGAEVTDLGVVGPLAVFQVIHQLRHQKVQVGIALAVGMGGHVDGQAIHLERQVRAVVQIEPAQEVLIALALTAVLGGDQPGHQFQQFGGPGDRALLQLRAEHIAFGGGQRIAGQYLVAAEDGDLLNCVAGNAGRLRVAGDGEGDGGCQDTNSHSSLPLFVRK